jgi:hypothetical protein
MADQENRTFAPTEAQTNRSRTQGLGVGQKEMDQQRDPSRVEHATEGDHPSLRGDMDGATNADRPSQADFGDTDIARDGDGDAEGSKPWLADGAPANVDVHDIGDNDNPEEDWGEPADEGAMHGQNHTRRALKTEAERGQGAKTRQANKDIISRRT